MTNKKTFNPPENASRFEQLRYIRDVVFELNRFSVSVDEPMIVYLSGMLLLELETLMGENYTVS